MRNHSHSYDKSNQITQTCSKKSTDIQKVVNLRNGEFSILLTMR